MAACFALPLAAWCRAQPRTEGSILQTSAKAPAIPAPCRLFSKRSSFFGDSVTSLCAPPRVFIARQPATTMEYRIKVDREKSARMRREKRDKMLDQRKVNVAQRRQQRRARLRDEEEEQRNTAEPSKGQIIQWYPGHIAKAERDIKASLSLVDLLLEIRDARIPMSTSHPDIEDFVSGGKGRARIMILNRLDMVSPSAKKQWNDFFKREGIAPVWTNARSGEATEAVVKAAVKLSQQVNERRTQRGMLPRPVRACVIGFPNVGKSALINRLMKRRVVDSARRAGVTKSLKWNTLGDTLQLLDAPGILPMNMSKRQADAVKLAICDDIGEASYNYEKVAAAFIDVVRELERSAPTLNPPGVLKARYGLDPEECIDGEDYVNQLAERRHLGDVPRTAREILGDFRTGRLGALALEAPPPRPPTMQNGPEAEPSEPSEPSP